MRRSPFKATARPIAACDLQLRAETAQEEPLKRRRGQSPHATRSYEGCAAPRPAIFPTPSAWKKVTQCHLFWDACSLPPN
jgi:hypothetical protein